LRVSNPARLRLGSPARAAAARPSSATDRQRRPRAAGAGLWRQRVGQQRRGHATLLADPLPPQTGNADLEREERVRDRLVDLGLQEVITYALTTPEREAPLAPAPAGYVTLVNPISTERSAMRHTVLAGVLEVVAFNLKHTDAIRVFEVGSVYLQRDGAKLPDEPRRLAVALTGKRAQPSWQDGITAPGHH